MSAYVAESGHWYRQDGTPCYTVEAKKGGMRDATLRDAKILNLVPSVTGIIRCASAPALEAWKIDRVLEAALADPKTPEDSGEMWCERIKSAGKEFAKKAAEQGTAIHASIEKYLLGEPITEYTEHTYGAVAAVERLCGERKWSPEKAFAHPLGFGGKADLHCTEGEQWLLDFKSKEFDSVGDVKLYDEHTMQLAACAKGLGLEKPRCGIVFVSRTRPGLATILELSEAEVSKGWRMFEALLSYYQAKNGWPWAVAA